MDFQGKNYWALILGGSSGFGLATAKRLSASGMNICIVHRDRKANMAAIEREFDAIRAHGVKFVSVNDDALAPQVRDRIQGDLPGILDGGRVRLLMHSIAFGNLKLLTPQKKSEGPEAAALLATELGIAPEAVAGAIEKLFGAGHAEFAAVAPAPQYNQELLLGDEDLSNTIYAMGTSLISWVQGLHQRNLFAADARVVGLTSEGNEVAWRGYAAVSAAKVALESISRSIAVEYAPFGIRSNIVQPGVTDTPALRLIPGSRHISANARLRNPLGRQTQTSDVANLIYLLSRDEAAWINGALIRCDGGEHVAS